MTAVKLENVHICSRHFISGQPADCFDELNPNRLPTLNLGHSKVKSSSTSEDRYQRKKNRVARVSEVVEPAAHYIQDPEGQVMCDECDAAVQTEETGKYNTQLDMELNFAYEIMHTLQESISRITPFTE